MGTNICGLSQFLGMVTSLKTRLINHPFYVKDMQEGETYPLTRDDITDWTIYFQDGSYTPDTIYKLLSGAQVH